MGGFFVPALGRKKTQPQRGEAPPPGKGPAAGRGQAVAPTMLRRSQIPFARIYEWWMGLRADPARCGLVVLLVWQIVPVLLLSRHSAPIHQHYLLLVIPGPLILDRKSVV